jgi:hypothetical protein
MAKWGRRGGVAGETPAPQNVDAKHIVVQPSRLQKACQMI